MPDLALTNDLLALLRDGGGVLAGVADMAAVPEDVRQGLPIGVAFALPITPEIVETLFTGPSEAYLAEYHRLNSALDALATQAVEWLQARGYHAVMQLSTFREIDRATLSTELPHKTVATRAGLGWIGKSALLVNEQYGSALRLTSILTDAPLAPNEPIDASRCGVCQLCRMACPGEAPTGAAWELGAPREAYYDAFACLRAIKAQTEQRGLTHLICGRCIAACPWTMHYLDRVG